VSGPPALPGLTYLQPLGSGGYADVFLYQQELPRRQVAVKVLKEQGLTDSLRSRFTAEANAMAGFEDHPNIVPVFMADIAPDGRPYIGMMYYSRPNLGVRASSERFSVAEVLRIGVQIAGAVETAHRADILHRDIKPANILTSRSGAPGLTDFGIAAQVAAAEEDDDSGVSVPWSPPEILYGTAPASPQSDIYSLAATLWNLLVGRSPFEIVGGDNTPDALMVRIRDLPAPSVGRSDVPAELDRLLQKAMAKDPAARPPSAMDFAHRLQAIEQAVHGSQTETVVLVHNDDPLASTATDPNGVDQATRRRDHATRIRVVPQAEAAVPQPATADRTRIRATAVPAQPAPAPRTPPEADATRRRAATVAADEPQLPSTEDQPRHRSPLPWVLGATAVAVAGLVLALTGAFTAGSGHRSPKTVGPTISSQNAALPGENIPPGSPVITAKAGDKAVVFSWTYSASLASDTYFWRRAGTSTQAAVTKPTVTVPDPGHAKVCIQVKVVRADGSNGSVTWSPEVCAT